MNVRCQRFGANDRSWDPYDILGDARSPCLAEIAIGDLSVSVEC
jgi:hypothetical protein